MCMPRGLAWRLPPLLLVHACALASSGSADATHHIAPPLLHDWPCPGCIVVLPHKVPRQAPLLVALHGDEGDPALVASMWGPVTAARGVILFAPQCPRSSGCQSSWWAWLQSGSTYDDGWLGRQTQFVERRYGIGRKREYLAGWSGGADFLGWYALRHADRFAGSAFVAGGVPYTSACPQRPMAGIFLGSDADFRTASRQPAQVSAILTRCGDPTAALSPHGLDHQATIMSLQTAGYGAQILRWLLQHHH
jgi:poly(3-hydroxybutyrate) depolymerase